MQIRCISVFTQFLIKNPDHLKIVANRYAIQFYVHNYVRLSRVRYPIEFSCEAYCTIFDLCSFLILCQNTEKLINTLINVFLDKNVT